MTLSLANLTSGSSTPSARPISSTPTPGNGSALSWWSASRRRRSWTYGSGAGPEDGAHPGVAHGRVPQRAAAADRPAAAVHNDVGDAETHVECELVCVERRTARFVDKDIA